VQIKRQYTRQNQQKQRSAQMMIFFLMSAPPWVSVCGFFRRDALQFLSVHGMIKKVCPAEERKAWVDCIAAFAQLCVLSRPA